MTKRASWPMRIDADAQTVGTARVRDNWAIGRSSAARQLMQQTGVQPPSEFDDIADGIGAPRIAKSSARSADVAAQIGATGPASTPLQRMQALGRLPAGRMNKTEAAYAELLAARAHFGEILEFKFESLKLRLAGRTWYTPDFALVLPDGTREIHEVKGHWTDDARVKIKVAAELYPYYRFSAVRRVKGEWVREVF